MSSYVIKFCNHSTDRHLEIMYIVNRLRKFDNHSFVQLLLIEFLICARNHSRYWECRENKIVRVSVLIELMF